MTPYQQRWAQMLTEHRASLGRIIGLSQRHPECQGLRANRQWAERVSRELEQYNRSLGDQGLGLWGPNGKAPAIRSQLRSSETMAELAHRGKVREKAA